MTEEHGNGFSRRESEIDFRLERIEEAVGRIERNQATQNTAITAIETKAGVVAFLVAGVVSVAGMMLTAWKAFRD